MYVKSLNPALSLFISRSLGKATRQASESLQRLSSGKRINSVFDGSAADTAIINRMDSQWRGIRQAILNVNNVGGLADTADAALSSMLNISYKLRELAQKATDSTLTSDERDLIEEEADGLVTDLSRLSTDTTYVNSNGNGIYLLDNSFGTMQVQAGPNARNTFTFSIGDARTSTLGKLAIYSGAQGAISAASVGNITFNSVSVEPSVTDGLSTSGGTYSSIAITNAITASQNSTGVYAESLGTNRTLSTDFAGAASFSGTFASGDFKINNVSITGTIADASDFVSAINGATSQTGVIATLSGTDVTLTASDGRNIQLQIATTTGAITNNVYDIFNFSTNQPIFSDFSSLSQGTDHTYVGAVRIWSSSAITIGGTNPSLSLGIASGSKGLVTATEVESIDLSSVEGADQASKVLDATIAQISSLRSNVGAVHDRVDYSASFLTESLNATETARSAIRDVDLVTETTNLVMAQILQDSGIAALTQANLSQARVLKLLENL